MAFAEIILIFALRTKLMDPLREHHLTPEAQAVPCHHERMRSVITRTPYKQNILRAGVVAATTAVASNGSGDSLSDSCGDGYVEGSGIRWQWRRKSRRSAMPVW